MTVENFSISFILNSSIFTLQNKSPIPRRNKRFDSFYDRLRHYGRSRSYGFHLFRWIDGLDELFDEGRLRVKCMMAKNTMPTIAV